MARMLPNEIPKRMPKHVAKVCSAFRRIKSDAIECRLSYLIDGVSRPEMLVLYKGTFATLVSVSALADEALDELIHGSLFSQSDLSDRLQLRECHLLESYLGALCEDIGTDSNNFGVQKWIVFPSASSKLVDRLAELIPANTYALVSREECNPESLFLRITEAASNPLESVILNAIKGSFNPEVAIPSSWIPASRSRERDTRASQTDFLLDYDQELAVKRDLELSDEAEQTLQSQGLRLVTGVAGCGKTLVLVFRARLAARLNEHAKILILTHNKPLCQEWNARLQELDPTVRVEWRTFYQWIHLFMPYKTISAGERERRIRALRLACEEGPTFSDAFLSTEFGWISDNAPLWPDLEWYLQVTRHGRKQSLQKSRREVVFDLFLKYYKELGKDEVFDWEIIPGLFLRHLEQQKLFLPEYDAIFIDEAQYFAPVWFECIRHAMRKPSCQVFMVADPTQGFLRHGQSWSHVFGYEMRGRSQRLHTPYRNTREILSFAKRFYLSRIPQDDEDVNLPTDEIIQTMPRGDAPILLPVSSMQDEKNRIVNEITALLQRGAAPSSILVIHCQSNQTQSFQDQLNQAHPGIAEQARDSTDRSRLRITSLNSCGGLEAPLVFVLEADSLFTSESSLQLDPFDQEEVVLRNTRKLFVAITRATRKLTITCRSEATLRLFQAVVSLKPHPPRRGRNT